jgi:hypothetical protein
MMARNRPIFIVRHLGLPTWLLYVAAGQFAYALAYLNVMLRMPRGARLEHIAAYLRGMVEGFALSCAELTRKGGQFGREL